MQISKFRHFSGMCSLILGILIAAPASSQDCPDTANLVKKLGYARLDSGNWWTCLDDIARREGERKAELADRKYQHNMGNWSGKGRLKRPAAFLFRSMNLTGKIQETNGINIGLDSDGLPGHFDTSKTLREISFGWSKKKILEDVIVMFWGPETLFNWKNADGSDSTLPRPWSVGNLLLERLTVDATVSHGRTVDFKEDINGLNDLDSLTTKTNWMVKVQYSIPIDKLFGLDYKNK